MLTPLVFSCFCRKTSLGSDLSFPRREILVLLFEALISKSVEAEYLDNG